MKKNGCLSNHMRVNGACKPLHTIPYTTIEQSLIGTKIIPAIMTDSRQPDFIITDVEKIDKDDIIGTTAHVIVTQKGSGIHTSTDIYVKYDGKKWVEI